MSEFIKKLLCKIGLHDYRRFTYLGCETIEYKHTNGITDVHFLPVSRQEIRCCRCNKKGTKCSWKKCGIFVVGGY